MSAPCVQVEESRGCRSRIKSYHPTGLALVTRKAASMFKQSECLEEKCSGALTLADRFWLKAHVSVPHGALLGERR